MALVISRQMLEILVPSLRRSTFSCGALDAVDISSTSPYAVRRRNARQILRVCIDVCPSLTLMIKSWPDAIVIFITINRSPAAIVLAGRMPISFVKLAECRLASSYGVRIADRMASAGAHVKPSLLIAYNGRRALSLARPYQPHA